jgi:hypothetical protein
MSVLPPIPAILHDLPPLRLGKLGNETVEEYVTDEVNHSDDTIVDIQIIIVAATATITGISRDQALHPFEVCMRNITAEQ